MRPPTHRLRAAITAFVAGDKRQGLVEYGLVLLIIAAMAIIFLVFTLPGMMTQNPLGTSPLL